METLEHQQAWQTPSKQELKQREASIERMIESKMYSAGARKALQENLAEIKRELAELDKEE